MNISRGLLGVVGCFYDASLVWGASVVLPVRVHSSLTRATDTSLPQEVSISSSSLLKAADIEARQIIRLEDVGRVMPGFTLGPQRAGGFPPQMFLRGLGARHLRVFVDGSEISDPSHAQAQFQGFAWSMQDVEQIRVFRGPQPGRFGSDAGSGVIDIQTYKPTQPFEGKTGVEIGRYGTRRGFSRAAGIVDHVDYKVSVQGDYRDGRSDFNERRGGHEKDPYRQWGGTASLGVQATDVARLEISARHSQEDQFLDSFRKDEDWKSDYDQRSFRAAFILDQPEHTLEHVLSVSGHNTHRTDQGNARVQNLYMGKRHHAGYVATWKAAPDLGIQVGADIRQNTYEQRSMNTASSVGNLHKKAIQWGTFLGIGATPVPHLDVFASGRADHTSATGGEQTWRLGSAYLFDGAYLTLHGSLGTSVQVPSLYEQYDPCYGNRTLKPEFLRGWDLGIRQELWGKRADLDVTWFRNDVRDAIGWSKASSESAGCSFPGRYQNTHKVRVQGVETEARVHISQKIILHVAHTWQTVINRQTGQRDKDYPRHQASAFVDWTVIPSINVSGSLRYRDRSEKFQQSTGAFLVAGVLAKWAINEQTTVYGRLDNIFNRRYEEMFGYGTSGRAAYVGVQISY